MKMQQTHSQMQTATEPSQVWQTLVATQQQTVLQIVVRVCHSLVLPQGQEESNESASDNTSELH
jgi:hypothetical protein